MFDSLTAISIQNLVSQPQSAGNAMVLLNSTSVASKCGIGTFFQESTKLNLHLKASKTPNLTVWNGVEVRSLLPTTKLQQLGCNVTINTPGQIIHRATTIMALNDWSAIIPLDSDITLITNAIAAGNITITVPICGNLILNFGK
jgi:hypothetical protein